MMDSVEKEERERKKDEGHGQERQKLRDTKGVG